MISLTEFHTYAVEWRENEISWFYDGELYYTLTPEIVGDREWVFNKEFFLLLNLAVGGQLAGTIGLDTRFPGQSVRRLRSGLSTAPSETG